MDGEAFDRLSVIVHRLRDQATRRNALRLLFGGSLVAATGLATEEANARRHKRRRHKKKRHKRRKNCRVGAIRCRRNRDCCFGRCRNGFCRNGGGGGGRRHCNGQRCPSGWECCSFQGRRQCLPRDHVFCGGNGICPIDGWERCGDGCCSPGTHCCHDNDFCLNDMFDCDDFFDVTAERTQENPTSEPIPFDEIDPEEYE